MKSVYKGGDFIMAGTNALKNVYTEMFKNIDKFYITNNKNKKLCTGDIVYNCDDLVAGSYEFRHGYTVHSLQGETINSKIFINLESAYGKMIYTAISRVRTMDNIYIIDDGFKISSDQLCVYCGEDSCDTYRDHKVYHKVCSRGQK